MMQPQDFLVGMVAAGLAVGSIFGIVSPKFLSDKWSVAKFVQLRFGMLAVRILFAVLAIIMITVAYELFVTNR